MARFAAEARTVAVRAQEEARALGSPQVEAAHVLIALSEGEGPAAGALATVGLDGPRARAAVERDFGAILAGVDVGPGALAVAGAPRPLGRRPRWGPSAKEAFERALVAARARRDRHIGSEHVLLGLLTAEHGPVARVLRREGVERDELEAQLSERR